MTLSTKLKVAAGAALLATFTSGTSSAQRPGGGGGRTAGLSPAGGARNVNRSPSMSRPSGPASAPAGARPNIGQPGAIQRPSPGGGGGGLQRPSTLPQGGAQRPNIGGGAGGGMQRPNVGQPGGLQRPSTGGNIPGIQRPNVGQPGGLERPTTGGNMPGPGRPNTGQPGGGFHRPNTGTGGGFQRPNTGNQGAPSRDALNDFLGGGGANNSPANRLPGGLQRPNTLPGTVPPPGIDRPQLNRPGGGGLATNPGMNLPGSGNTNIGRGAGANVNVGAGGNTLNNVRVGGGNTTNVNIGNVNVGNRINYANNSQAWVSQRQNWGNDVRAGVGGRYNNVFNDNWFRRGPVVGGYNYYRGWAGRGPYFAWTPMTWASLGAVFGASLLNARPVYFAYGQGGNVYYENNIVYVNGQAAGTPQEYYAQAQSLAAAAPPADQVNAQQQDDWMPLGVFALTSEETGDSQAVLQLAVNKQGIIAGTYFNEATQASRPVQGSMDVNTQRVAMGFADNKNTDKILETSINNLTQDEAPALLHFGADQSQPMLLVRLKQPDGAQPAQ